MDLVSETSRDVLTNAATALSGKNKMKKLTRYQFRSLKNYSGLMFMDVNEETQRFLLKHKLIESTPIGTQVTPKGVRLLSETKKITIKTNRDYSVK